MDLDIELSAVLFDNTMLKEFPVPLEMIREEEKDGVKIAFVRLRIPEVETDEHTLNFVAQHTTSDAASHIARDYLIEGGDKRTISSNPHQLKS